MPPFFLALTLKHCSVIWINLFFKWMWNCWCKVWERWDLFLTWRSRWALQAVCGKALRKNHAVSGMSQTNDSNYIKLLAWLWIHFLIFAFFICDRPRQREMSWVEEDWTVGLSGRVAQKVKELQVHHERLSRENKQKQLQVDNIHASLAKQTVKV